MASAQSFSRFYLLSAADGEGGFEQISPQDRNGGTQGTFLLSDRPASSGSDDLDILGDRPNDIMQVVHTIGGTDSTFNNREYVGQTAGEPGVVARFFSNNTGGYVYFLYANAVYNPNDAITFSSTPFVLCFASGTRILTTRGEVAVEDLQVGDTAVTAVGEHRPITWIGHRHLGTKAQPLAPEQAPVRVCAGAFGHGLPTRDLLLSPGHPVLVGADADNEGGVLVPVMCLINGTSIARTNLDSVGYWHVELDRHDILLAEGLPAESFLDFGCRPFFAEASDHALHNPDFVAPGLSGRCRPVAVDGPCIEAERARLATVFAARLTNECAWSVGPEAAGLLG